MSEYEVWLKGRVDLTVDANSADEAKQILADALADWGITEDMCDAIEIGSEK